VLITGSFPQLIQICAYAKLVSRIEGHLYVLLSNAIIAVFRVVQNYRMDAFHVLKIVTGIWTKKLTIVNVGMDTTKSFKTNNVKVKLYIRFFIIECNKTCLTCLDDIVC
jgi:hypothetical protein